MPSINTIISGLAVTAFSLMQISLAAPAAQAPASKIPVKATATLPKNGGARELAAPTTALVQVAIGRGIQNYTCSAVGAAPVAIGAIATLYDATSLALSNPTALHALTAAAVLVPAGKNNACFELPRSAKLARSGTHFFSADGTPNFVLNNKKSIQAKKNDGIPAPPTAAKGPNGSGAVDWLQLVAKPAPYVSVGISTVYRVETAGGKQTPTCASVGTLSVQYATEYWFYV